MSDRTISGMATTSAVDRSGDVVDPAGATFKVPFPLLLGHDHNKPIGTVVSLQKLANGLLAKAVLVPEGISEDADRAWGLIQAKALAGLSIGFRPLAVSDGDLGLNYDKTEIYELSVVAVPCNADCAIVAFNAEAKSAKPAPARDVGAAARRRAFLLSLDDGAPKPPVKKRQLLLIPTGTSAKSRAIMQTYNEQAAAYNKHHGLS